MMTSILLFLYFFDLIISLIVIRYKGMLTPVYQREQYDCGLACASTLTSCYGNFASLNLLRRDCRLGVSGLSLKALVEILARCGIACCCKKVAVSHFHQLTGPAICHLNKSHYVIFLKRINEEYYYFDPARGFRFASASTWKDMISGFVLLPLSRASPRKKINEKLTSFISYNPPLLRYICQDLILSIVLWFALSSLPGHIIIFNLCYSLITILLFRTYLTRYLYWLKTKGSHLTLMTRYLFHYQNSIFRRLSTNFFHIRLVFIVLCAALSLHCFSASMLISGVFMFPLTFWSLFLHQDLSGRYYIDRTYSARQGKQFKSSIVILRFIVNFLPPLLIGTLGIGLYLAGHQLSKVTALLFCVTLLSYLLFITYLDLKEFLLILNAYDMNFVSDEAESR